MKKNFVLNIIILLFSAIFLVSCSKKGVRTVYKEKVDTILTCEDFGEKRVKDAHYNSRLNFRYKTYNNQTFETEKNCSVEYEYFIEKEIANVYCRDRSQNIKGPFHEYKEDDKYLRVYKGYTPHSHKRAKKDCHIVYTIEAKRFRSTRIKMTKWTPETKKKEIERIRRRKQDDDDAALMLFFMM